MMARRHAEGITKQAHAPETRAGGAFLGIDVGGTGIKGAPVDSLTGSLLAERFRVRTPRPATPDRVAETVAEVVRHFEWTGAVGCGFPAVIRHGRVRTAANIDRRWIGCHARELFEDATGRTFTVVNDADVAGLAEVAFGAGRDRMGVVLVVTLGTGIGTALFVDGKMAPNTELGHIELKGMDAERYAADSVREREQLTWKKWARRVDRYLCAIHALLWPDLIVIGGGAAKKHERFLPLLTVDTEVVPARLRNEAGIVGAALAASMDAGPPGG
jgi:polyphosphate glucokinase